jgi:histone acetyltransferase (RNA polymerase elongator complex component)
MKVIGLHAIGKEEMKIDLIVGPGVFFAWAEQNKATFIETIKGTILVKETPEQIKALIKQGDQENGTD